VTDVVVAGHDRDEAVALVIPNLAACRALADALNREADPAEILACDGVRGRFASLLNTFNAEAGGSSRRLARLILMDDPPSLDSGEMTDKGSVNQRAVLSRRAAMVEELYAKRPSPRTIV
jgi:feruloyl-CoA synthase